ncbi:very short patch repair endonuclease [Geomonas sp. RF6]|uniref:very short patch repair endonuclease n=1 Tax=Geomonas sp. RF6 TaxID=2897342 RepID=UPI001E411EEB|nr:very short patch repair endonuclease [Geomonas sp. RF6]UFS71769.1 very short patch repair endonuclease [Geomonas sp. RF6]
MNRSEMMAAVRSKNTRPEMLVRRLIHSLGYRYRIHRPDLPGKPDLVFPSRKKVIFVHGCFWHQHGCKSSHFPKTNQEYWVPKLEKNVTRDASNLAALAAAGWSFLILWECELKDVSSLQSRICKFLDAVDTPE